MTTQLKRFLTSCSERDFETKNPAKSRTAKKYLELMYDGDTTHYTHEDTMNGHDVHIMLLVLQNPAAEI